MNYNSPISIYVTQPNAAIFSENNQENILERISALQVTGSKYSMSVATWHNYSLQFIDQIWNITWWTALLPDGQTDKYSVNFQLTRLGLVPPPGPGPAPSLENILIEVARSYLLPQILHTSIHYECIFRILNSMKRPSLLRIYLWVKRQGEREHYKV